MLFNHQKGLYKDKDIFLVVCATSLSRTLITNSNAPSTRQDTTLSERLCVLCRERKKDCACSKQTVVNTVCPTVLEAEFSHLLLVGCQVPGSATGGGRSRGSTPRTKLSGNVLPGKAKPTKMTKQLLQKPNTVSFRVIHTDRLILTVTEKVF